MFIGGEFTMQYTLIVTHGRTGSTLLQGILNAIDGWHIKGESDNFAYGLYKSYKSLKKACSYKDQGDPYLHTNPWFGVADYDLDGYFEKLAELIKELLISGQSDQQISCNGFKEVRYFEQVFEDDKSGEQLKDYLDFLSRALHPCKMIFLQRDPNEVIKSDWWDETDNNKKEETINTLKLFNSFLNKYSEENKNSTFCIDYKDITYKSENLKKMFLFLGGSPSDDVLSSVQTTRHSYNARSVLLNSVPAFNRDHPEMLTKANQFHINRDFENAKACYLEVVKHYEQGLIKSLPFYVCNRAGRQAFIVRAAHTHKIAYFPIPKSGSSSISQLLYHIINGEPYTKDTTDDASVNIHQYFNAGQCELSLDKYDDYFKFTVVRDPIKRFVSAYRNRIVHHNDLKETLKIMNIYNQIPRINHFAMELEDFILRDQSTEIHFEPISKRFGKTFDIIDQVIPIEKLSTLPQILSNKAQIPEDSKLPHVQTGGPSFSINDLSKEALEKLIIFYKDDYELLADYYSPEKIRKEYQNNIDLFANLSLSMNISKI